MFNGLDGNSRVALVNALVRVLNTIAEYYERRKL